MTLVERMRNAYLAGRYHALQREETQIELKSNLPEESNLTVRCEPPTQEVDFKPTGVLEKMAYSWGYHLQKNSVMKVTVTRGKSVDTREKY